MGLLGEVSGKWGAGAASRGKMEKGDFFRPCYLGLMWRFGILPRDPWLAMSASEAR